MSSHRDHHAAERRPLPTPEELKSLPRDGGPHWNRLVFEKSPYLLQHAANPVDWYSWGEEAFAAARAQDKPIFLSVGYATCHWCHVMERESFEDPEVAQLLNDAFVCVKVDREERPDVDHVYMNVTQVLTRSGGWPMTIVMTPDKEPFFAGTYFPKHGRGQRPGVMQLVPMLASAWREGREHVVTQSQRLVAALVEMNDSAPGARLGEPALRATFDQLAERFDPLRGGFGHAPKFPTPHQFSFLLRWWKRSGEQRALDMVVQTLDAMRRGGIFDHVGFGLHRYSTDRDWLVPHFEKMLYDQALLAVAALEAFQATGEARHATLAREVFTYVLRDLTSPDGAFYSAEDADSEGEEGKFYLWTPEEVRAVLGEEDAATWCRVFDVVPGGNFRDEATGRMPGGSIPHLEEPLADVAAALGLDEATLVERLERSRGALLEARSRRVRPLLDDKVLADWNGLMIAAFARGACVLGDPSLADAAARAADFVLARLRDGRGRLLKRWRDGEAGLPAVLDDHAFMAHGLLELYEATFDARWLDEARALVDDMLEHFWDAQRGAFFMTADDGEPLPVRPKDVYDGAIPSGNSVAALVLARLGRLLGDPDLEIAADAVLRAFAGGVARQPSAHCELMIALDFALGPSHEVVVAGEPGRPDTDALLAALRRPFLPNAVVALRPPGEAPPITRLATYTTAQVALDGRATAYVCRNQACHAPTTDVAEMLRSLGVDASRPS